MANPNNPFGFRLGRHVTGGTPGRTNSWPVASAYGTDIFYGDPVASDGSGNIIKATNATSILGVFLGVNFIGADGTPTFSPKWQASVGAEYVTNPILGGFTLAARGDMNFTSRQYTTNDLNPQGIVDEVTLFGARVTLTSPDRTWTVAAYGENLTDEGVFRTKFAQILDPLFGVRNPATGSTLMRGFMGTPRMYGVRVAKTF